MVKYLIAKPWSVDEGHLRCVAPRHRYCAKAHRRRHGGSPTREALSSEGDRADSGPLLQPLRGSSSSSPPSIAMAHLHPRAMDLASTPLSGTSTAVLSAL